MYVVQRVPSISFRIRLSLLIRVASPKNWQWEDAYYMTCNIDLLFIGIVDTKVDICSSDWKALKSSHVRSSLKKYSGLFSYLAHPP